MVFMNKRIKSVASAAAAFALSVSVCCAGYPVSAAATPVSMLTSVSSAPEKPVTGGTALERAVRDARSRVDIPAEYSEFTYTKSTSDAHETYQLCWETCTGSNDKSITVSISDGIITGYDTYDPEYQEYSGKPSFCRFSDEQLMKSASEIVKELDPQIADEISFSAENISQYLTSRTVSVGFTRKAGGAELEKNYGSVTVDKMTGRLVRFELTWWEDAAFADVDSAGSVSEFRKAYKKKSKLVPSYRICRDGSRKTAVVVYSPEKNAVIDARTAKPTAMYDDYNKAMNTSGYYFDDTVGYGSYDSGFAEEAAAAKETAPRTGKASVNSMNYQPTPAESQAFIDSGKYLSKTDIIDRMKKDKYLGLNDKYVLGYAEFRKSYDESAPSGYVWYMNFYISDDSDYKSIDVTADAVSGTPVQFWKYDSSDYDGTAKKKTDPAKAKKVAAEAAKYYLSDIFGEYRLSDGDNSDNGNSNTYSAVFERVHENIKVSGNDINISVNSKGEVMSFSYSYDNVDFESPDIISEDKAFEKLFAQKDPDLYYDGFLTLDGKAKTYLLYGYESFNINAKTGKLCDYYGRNISADKDGKGCPYTDITGNRYEKYIRMMYDYGVVIDSDTAEFRPDEAITEYEFAQLLDNMNYSGIVYSLYGNTGADSSGKALTREMSAKLLVISAGGKDFAELNGIYKSPFKDVPADSANAGYIALAYGMGAAKPDADGSFRPKAKVTRGYAMYLLCCYIENCSK